MHIKISDIQRVIISMTMGSKIPGIIPNKTNLLNDAIDEFLATRITH